MSIVKKVKFLSICLLVLCSMSGAAKADVFEDIADWFSDAFGSGMTAYNTDEEVELEYEMELMSFRCYENGEEIENCTEDKIFEFETGRTIKLVAFCNFGPITSDSIGYHWSSSGSREVLEDIAYNSEEGSNGNSYSKTEFTVPSSDGIDGSVTVVFMCDYDGYNDRVYQMFTFKASSDDENSDEDPEDGSEDGSGDEIAESTSLSVNDEIVDSGVTTINTCEDEEITLSVKSLGESEIYEDGTVLVAAQFYGENFKCSTDDCEKELSYSTSDEDGLSIKLLSVKKGSGVFSFSSGSASTISPSIKKYTALFGVKGIAEGEYNINVRIKNQQNSLGYCYEKESLDLTVVADDESSDEETEEASEDEADEDSSGDDAIEEDSDDSELEDESDESDDESEEDDDSDSDNLDDEEEIDADEEDSSLSDDESLTSTGNFAMTGGGCSVIPHAQGSSNGMNLMLFTLFLGMIVLRIKLVQNK